MNWTGKISLSLVMIVIFALLVGCQPADPVCESRFSNGDSFENTCGMNVEPGAQGVTLKMKANLSQGSLNWTLIDPQGQITWQSNAEAGNPVDIAWTTEKPIPGRWILKIKSDQAIGDYQAPWIVR